MKEVREYLRAKPPAPFPSEFTVDKARAAGGKPIFDQYCGTCHSWNGRYLGKVIPIEEIGTDRERFDTWSQEDADATNRVAKEMGVDRKAMVKDVGYASQPLDGIWLRAPYLHNGSVPTLRDLLNAPENRPDRFFRGCDIYDPVNMGFFSRKDDACPRAFDFDTKQRGNGNGGHVYGTQLTPAEKDLLLEYMKTM